MGQVYNMAMIRQVFSDKASEMSILNSFLDRFLDYHPINPLYNKVAGSFTVSIATKRSKNWTK